MEATPSGRSGQIVLLNVEEEDAAAIDNVPILCHNMAETIVRTLGQRLRQKTAIKTDAQVKVAFVAETREGKPHSLAKRVVAKIPSLSNCVLGLPHERVGDASRLA